MCKELEDGCLPAKPLTWNEALNTGRQYTKKGEDIPDEVVVQFIAGLYESANRCMEIACERGVLDLVRQTLPEDLPMREEVPVVVENKNAKK